MSGFSCREACLPGDEGAHSMDSTSLTTGLVLSATPIAMELFYLIMYTCARKPRFAITYVTFRILRARIPRSVMQ